MTASPLVSLAFGVFAWVPLYLSAFGALASESNGHIAAPLVIAAVIAVAGFVAGVVGLKRARSAPGQIGAALGLLLNGAVLAVGGIWALSVHWQ